MSSPRRSRQRRAAQQQTQRAQLIIGDAATIRAAAATFTCPDCASERGTPWRDRHGITHVPIAHDNGCPYLAGITS